VRTTVFLLWIAAAAAAEEPRAFVELTCDAPEVYVDQRFRMTLRFGYDTEYFEKHAVQLFQQKLGVPVHVEAPGMNGRYGPQAGPTIALNDDLRRVEPGESVDRGGRTFTVLTLTKTMTITEPGDTTFAAPTLRFASGTKFREDFVHGRVAIDRRDTVVEGAPVVLRVLAIPDDGRPVGWTDAVGPLAIRTEASPRELDEGQTFELKLWITGGGNVATIAAPVLEQIGLQGFHVLGALAAEAEGGRLFTYTLQPLGAEADQIPALSLPYFDPTPPARFRSAQSTAIPITVRAKPVERDETPQAKPEPETFPFAAIIGAVIAVCVVMFLGARRRAQARDVPSAAFQQFQARGDADLADAYADYLAAKLGCARAAVISPDLKDRLVKAGIEEQLASTAADRMERLTAARYGGGDPTDATLQSPDDLVRTLERMFAREEKRDQ